MWSILSAVNTVNLVNTVNAVRNPPPPESNHAQCWSEFGSLTILDYLDVVSLAARRSRLSANGACWLLLADWRQRRALGS
jgi:hypothetical protein